MQLGMVVLNVVMQKKKHILCSIIRKIDDTLTNTLSIRNSDYKRLSIGSKSGSAQRNRYKTLSISDYMTKNFDDKHLVTVGVDYTKDDDVVKSETSYSKIYNRLFMRRMNGP